MSLTNYIYKLNKYNSKLEKNPDNLIYKKKYIYYLNLVGGFGLNWAVVGLVRVGALCRSEAMIKKDLVAKATQLTGQQLVEETTKKILNFTFKAKNVIKELEKGGLDKIGKGDIPLQLKELDNVKPEDLTSAFKSVLINYAENPTCPVTSINITGKDENTIAADIMKNMDKIVDNISKSQVLPKIATSVEKLSPAALEVIRKIYLTVND